MSLLAAVPTIMQPAIYVANCRKPIELPKGVEITVAGNTVAVKGPKGTVQTHLPEGVAVERKDGLVLATRQDDSHAAVHGLEIPTKDSIVEVKHARVPAQVTDDDNDAEPESESESDMDAEAEDDE